jgi:hypothetical protein
MKNNHLLSNNVESMWLEFDILNYTYLNLLPCVFLSINRDKFNHKILIEISSRLLNHQLSSSFKYNLKHCINCLPSGAYVDYLGAMLSRSEPTIRIISLISSNQILKYLKQIGWSGSQEIIESLLLKLSKFTRSICLSYDVGERVLPRIGIEFFLYKQPKYDYRWNFFLDYLVDLNLCSYLKKEALLNWFGYSKITSNSNFLSTFYDKSDCSSVIFKSPQTNILIRRVSHIKIVYNSDKSLEAKAYLGLDKEPVA